MELVRLAQDVGPIALARERVLPVLPPLQPLLPAGLQRGIVVAVGGVGATSLALALAAGPVQRGSWAVAVGWPQLGLVAAQKLGLRLDRLAVVTTPPPELRAEVLAALVGSFDVVLAPAGLRISTSGQRRLAARLRERGSVLVRVGEAGDGTGADLRGRVVSAAWEGLGHGHGHLQGRRAVVEVDGRGAAGRSRRAELWLPGPNGELAEILPAPTVLGSRPRLVAPAGDRSA